MCHQANASDGNPLASRKAKGCHGGSSRAEIPSIVKGMGELATGPTAQPQNRLKAIDVLLRAAATDHPVSSDAKAHLSRSRCFWISGGPLQAVCPLVQGSGIDVEAIYFKVCERQKSEPKQLDRALLVKRRQGGFDMLRDFHDLWLLVSESMMSLIVLEQAGRALRDRELLGTLKNMQDRNQRQLTWLKTRINQAAPQVLVVPI